MQLGLVFEGEPFSKQSFQVKREKELPEKLKKKGLKKKKVSGYHPERVKKKENAIIILAKSQLPRGFEIWDSPIRIKEITYIFPILSNMPEKTKEYIRQGGIVYKAKKPDLTDNLQKGLIDALSGVVFTDDSRIVEVEKERKIFGEEPRTELVLEKINQKKY